MASEIARPEGSAWAEVTKANTDMERYQAGQYAIEAVDVAGFDHPVPRFFFDLPWADAGDTVIDGILAQLASAPDISQATGVKELRKARDLVGQPVTVLGVSAVSGDLEDSRWGAYTRLTVSVDGGAPEVLNVSAAQVQVTMWRLFCEGLLPASGRFVELAAAKKGRNAPLGFSYEEKF
jgi:hypothetical protein